MAEFAFGAGAAHIDDFHELIGAEELGIAVENVSFIAPSVEGALVTARELREKNSTVSQSESGFIPEGALGKTVGLSYELEAQ